MLRSKQRPPKLAAVCPDVAGVANNLVA